MSNKFRFLRTWMKSACILKGKLPLYDRPAQSHGCCIRQNKCNYHDSLKVHLIEGIDCPWSIFHNKAELWRELTTLTLLSMTSLSLLRSSSAVSQFCMRISDPSFPQRAFKVFLSSLPGTCVETKIIITNLTRLHIGKRIILSPNPWKCRFKVRNLQAHDKSTNTLQHQSSFHTHIEILHICTVCPAFLV